MKTLPFTLLTLLFYTSVLFAKADIPTTMPTGMDIARAVQAHTSPKSKKYVDNIYHGSKGNVIWMHNTVKRNELLQALSSLRYNYKQHPFNQKEIHELIEAIEKGNYRDTQLTYAIAKADVLLSEAYIYLVNFIVRGDVDWALVRRKIASLAASDGIKAKWEMRAKKSVNYTAAVQAALQGNITNYLDTLLPMRTRYLKLINILKHYRNMDDFPTLKYSNSLLEEGDISYKAGLLKRRLKITGDYGGSDGHIFNKELTKALKRFQSRYLIEVTGKLDKITTYYLNLSRTSRIKAIKTNLDKTKLYPRAFESEHVEVNIPEFMLRYYRGTLNHKAELIVGRIDRPTPLFSDSIEHIVLNPTWSIPNSLIKKDLIPVLKEDPNYMKDNDIHAYSGNKQVYPTYQTLAKYQYGGGVPYRFVQKPGDHNALGRVKFMFPNKHAVYLHDTDNHDLFNRRYKIYSSGCVRIKEPFAFAKKLLGYTNIGASKMEHIVQSMRTTTVRLNKSIPIHMLYFTVFEDEDGLEHFKHDIYLYDKMIEESTYSNYKPTFSMPKKRMITVKRTGTVSN